MAIYYLNPIQMKNLKFTVVLLVVVLATTTAINAQLNKAYFFYKGEELLSKGQYNKALPFLNTLIGIDSTLSEGWFLRGVAK